MTFLYGNKQKFPVPLIRMIILLNSYGILYFYGFGAIFEMDLGKKTEIRHENENIA